MIGIIGNRGDWRLVRDFHKNHKRERRDIKLVEPWLELVLSLKKMREATYHEQVTEHIDYVGITDSDAIIKIEVKIRYSDWGDLLLETYSNFEGGSLGCLFTSSADYLKYVILVKGDIVRKYILYLPELRRWWLTVGRISGYEIKDSKNFGYTTRSRAVPYSHFPLELFYYHDSYGLLYREELDSSYFR